MTNTTNPTQKFYAVAWSRDGRNPSIVDTSALDTAPETAKTRAAELNAAMKPEYQNYTVATITFDPEV